MRLVTSYGMCDDGLTAAVNWRFSARSQVPFGAINAILAAHYNLCEAGKGELPYIYNVSDHGRQVGFFIAGIRRVDDNGVTVGVDVSGDAGQAIFDTIMQEEAQFPRSTPWKPGDWHVQTAWREEESLAVVRWSLPDGQVFPVECLNVLLYGMYIGDIRPYFYPVFDPEDESGMTPQIGVLLAARREQSGTPEQFARKATEDFRGLMSFSSGDKMLPWEDEVFDVE